MGHKQKHIENTLKLRLCNVVENSGGDGAPSVPVAFLTQLSSWLILNTGDVLLLGVFKFSYNHLQQRLKKTTFHCIRINNL